ncbi:MAG: four helix bundle protein [Caldilineaceae bacterium]|nr:four helix bundle protein [Caldilineaceae bacterium]
MAAITRFEDIRAWQMARQLTNEIYAVTKRPAFRRDWGLTNQIRDASGSVMHNIAEGFDAGSDAEFIRFLRYARRSATEVQSQLYLSLDQSYISQEEFQHLYDLSSQCRNAITGFIRYLSTKT